MKKIDANEIHVWRIPLHSWDISDKQELRVLSDDEVKRANDIRHLDVRRQYLKSRYALRCILGGYVPKAPQEIELGVLPHGKPVLNDSMQSRVTFNLSHSGNVGLCAIAYDADIGIDIEKVREIRRFDDFVLRYMSPVEAQGLMACATENRLNQFFKYWTSKEAYLKAIGIGLRADLRLPVPSDWTLLGLDVDSGYVATLAVQRPAVAISYFDWRPDV